MRVRHFNNKKPVGDLWTDEDGVVQSDPPGLRHTWDSTYVVSWPEHPDEILRIADGEEWLRGLLWMGDTGQFHKGEIWLAVVDEENPDRLTCPVCLQPIDVVRRAHDACLPVLRADLRRNQEDMRRKQKDMRRLRGGHDPRRGPKPPEQLRLDD